MDNIISSDIVSQAKEKIKEQTEKFNSTINQSKAVYRHIASMLLTFCENEYIANAVLASDKTLTECCDHVVKGAQTFISDFEVYKRAVQFYIPLAKIKFNMELVVPDLDVTVTTDTDCEFKASDISLPDAKPKRKRSSTPKPKEKNKTSTAGTKIVQLSLFEEDD